MGKASLVGGLLFLASASAVSGACSDGSKSTGSTPSTQPSLNIAAAVGVSSASEAGSAPAADAAPASGDPDFSYAIAVPVPPQTTCTVHPEGVSKDPTRTAVVWGGADGEIRFYPPPQAWGPRLTLDCTLNGSPQGTYLVDLNASFKRESGSALEPTFAGVRP